MGSTNRHNLVSSVTQRRGELGFTSSAKLLDLSSRGDGYWTRWSIARQRRQCRRRAAFRCYALNISCCVLLLLLCFCFCLLALLSAQFELTLLIFSSPASRSNTFSDRSPRKMLDLGLKCLRTSDACAS